MASSSGISRWQFVHELDQKSTSVTVPDGWPRELSHSEAWIVGITPQSFAPLRAHCAKSVLASTSFSGSHAPSSQASPVLASSAAV